MSTANWLYMVAILGLVWGGFAYCLFLLITQQDADHDGAPTDRDSDERSR